MNKLKCPRYENKELKRSENYCPICGLNLKERTAQEVLVQEQSDTLEKIKLTDIVSEMIKKTNKH
ncbi:hypothetical protein [Clostridium perfringens]|uniref:hypothetical protein n=1 Tax=Clostridium perfringens TaxID=1502 RepID=UPI0008A70342|nr:hypothetical protein [Clostridium perfringens]AOY53663.1 hypothetical protein FORC25_1247 [Clostridium perfringens]EJT5934015.1 hypothetical protein [Clostridium perfringens]ELC8347504.1 hypothetical protein [Clostridium perfringens]TBX12802.1 hypothetical protein BFS03_06055 [Clostridium perfringens]HBI7336924.1 hypothetical protein [Clostridium perfringens]